MPETVEVLFEKRRGCGYRQPGGLYAFQGGFTDTACCLLPQLVDSCASCGAGIKPARGWTWVKPEAILDSPFCEIAEFREQSKERFPFSDRCPARFLAHGFDPATGLKLEGKVGLLWIGAEHYALPSLFVHEARTMGISRRLTQIPRDFTVDRDWILLGHRKAAGSPPEYHPGIFMLWKPKELQYVLKPTDTAEDVRRMLRRGIRPVIVEPWNDRGDGWEEKRTFRVVPE